MTSLFETTVSFIVPRVERGEFVSLRDTMLALGVEPNTLDATEFDSEDQIVVAEAFAHLSVDNLEGPGLIDVAPGKGGNGDMVFAKSSLI